MPRLVIAILFVCLSPCFAIAQQISHAENDIDTTNTKDIIDVFNQTFKVSQKKIARRRGKKVYFSLLPTSAPVPGGGRALITSTNAGFYLGDRRNTFLSNVSFSPYLNFKGRYAISFHNDIYTKQNKWNIQGDIRFSVYPEYVYGTKANNRTDERLLLTYKYIRFYQTVLKRIKPYLLVGMGYNLDYHIGIRTVNDTIGLTKFTNYEHGTAADHNSFSSGITFNLLYDSRNNSINPLPGGYFNVIYRVNPLFMGNGTHTWNSLFLDSRKYISLPGKKHHLVAVWNYVWTALSNNVPYLDLPGIGYEPNQRSGRGIDQNRYRGKSLIYLEGEYRSDITNNGLLGFVAFANANTVTGPADGSFSGVHPAIGAGLRVKFNKRSNTNIAADFGVSKGHSTFSLGLGEAF